MPSSLLTHKSGRATPVVLCFNQTTMVATQPAAAVPIVPDQEQAFDRTFKPHGAIAFFVLLVLLGLVIWFGIYFIMLQRV